MHVSILLSIHTHAFTINRYIDYERDEEYKQSICKLEAMAFCWKAVDCSLKFGSQFALQVKEFKYPRVLFTSEGKMETNINSNMDNQPGSSWVVSQNMFGLFLFFFRKGV